jgi:hypothetical protein
MRIVALALVLGIAACGPEPSFDERYGRSANKIEARAQNLDEAVKASPDKLPDGNDHRRPD